jgi:hypothetical protein
MKAKQILAVVLISATTAVGSMWGYQKFSTSNTYVYSSTQQQGKMPGNYAGYFDGVVNTANAPADFTAAAAAAIPATVHIKTKTIRQANNNLPR